MWWKSVNSFITASDMKELNVTNKSRVYQHTLLLGRLPGKTTVTKSV